MISGTHLQLADAKAWMTWLDSGAWEKELVAEA